MERDREIEFVGLWSDVESLNECEALPADVSSARVPFELLLDLRPISSVALICLLSRSWMVLLMVLLYALPW